MPRQLRSGRRFGHVLFVSDACGSGMRARRLSRTPCRVIIPRIFLRRRAVVLVLQRYEVRLAVRPWRFSPRPGLGRPRPRHGRSGCNPRPAAMNPFSPRLSPLYVNRSRSGRSGRPGRRRTLSALGGGRWTLSSGRYVCTDCRRPVLHAHDPAARAVFMSIVPLWLLVLPLGR